MNEVLEVEKTPYKGGKNITCPHCDYHYKTTQNIIGMSHLYCPECYKKIKVN